MSRRDKLAPEPMNVYTWMLLAAMVCMGYGIFLIRKELRDTYELQGMPKVWGMGDGMTEFRPPAE